jgi:hypothetical protein
VGVFHGFGKFKQAADGSEFEGNWYQNQIKGQGTKRCNDGEIEISGIFDSNGLVNGKGTKKWKKVTYE